MSEGIQISTALGSFLTTNEMQTLKDGMIKIVLDNFEDSVVEFSKQSFLFDPDSLEELFKDALDEAREEVKEHVKKEMIKKMMEKVSKMSITIDSEKS